MAGILFDLNGLKVLYGLAFCIFYARNAHRRLSQPTVCMFSLEPISKIIDLSVWVLWYKEMFVPFRPLPSRSPGRIKNFIDFLCENISPFNQIAAEKRKTKSKKKRSASLKYWIFTVKHSIWLLKSSHQELYDSQKESLRNILVEKFIKTSFNFFFFFKKSAWLHALPQNQNALSQRSETDVHAWHQFSLELVLKPMLFGSLLFLFRFVCHFSIHGPNSKCATVDYDKIVCTMYRKCWNPSTNHILSALRPGV